MYSPSFEFLKSPFENVVNLVPQGHEKAVKHGLYNALALLALLASLAAGWALYIILEPFFKPLMWALLCGSVLYPFKYSLAKSLQGWLDGLTISSTPLLVGVVIIPLQLIDEASEKVGNLIFRFFKYILAALGGSVLIFVVYNYTPHLCSCLMWQLGVQTNVAIAWIIGNLNIYLMFAVLVVYVSTLVFYWHPEMSRQFTFIACLVWIFISAFIASLASSFQVSIFFLLQMSLAAGFFYEAWLIHKEESQSNKETTYVEAICAAFHGRSPEKTVPQGEHHDEQDEKVSRDNSDQSPDSTPSTSLKKSESSEKQVKDGGDSFTEIGKLSGKVDYVRTRPVSSLPSLTVTSWPQRTSSLSITGRQRRAVVESQLAPAMKQFHRKPHFAGHLDDSDDGEYSTKFLYMLLWLCGIMLLGTHIWMSIAVSFLLIIYMIRHAGHYIGLWQMMSGQLQNIRDIVFNWCEERRDALFPVPVTGLYKLMVEINLMILEIVKSSVDSAASIVVILGLIIFTTLTLIFLSVQMYSESILLLQMGGNAINNTFMRNSQLMEMLPASWQSQVDSVLDDAYSYGRQGISKMVHQSLKDVDPVKAEQLEKQVLELWDRIYQSWMASNSEANIVGPTVTSGAVFTSWGNIVDSVQKTPELFNMQAVITFAQDNVGMLLTVWDSIWNIFKGNITLAADFCTALLAILFGGGTAVVNFFVNLIVFFTALFYLLASSGDMYIPVDMISQFSPHSGNRFAVALEVAIASVFKASFNRAVILGLWTWFIHNLFQVKLVYIPCVMATVFGAVPFIGPYWASFPAMLELYFSQDNGLAALMLLVVQFVAASVVDGFVYSEIKGGGHPYLTGLSIAGGMFCLGAEGAILGPLLLCALYVAINMSTSIMTESPTEREITEGMKRLGHLGQIKRIGK
ncbi:transmembrane protein 245 isoform X2 [Anabrus simplex]|uniref:transmembrane protein 245 isoform X2 n=1 Tax=Anabrus simplex TaxID=316456 RepID=UPI0035A380F6